MAGVTRTADPASAAGSGGVVTYSSASTGTAAADRLTAVLLSWETTDTLSRVTIDTGSGEADMKLEVNVKFSTTIGAAGAWIHNPTGTTATFRFYFSGTPAVNTTKISVYNISSAAAAISQAVSATSTDMDASSPLSVSVTIPTSGVGIAVASCAAAGTALKSWTSFTEEQELNVTNYTHTTATKTTAGTANCVCTGTTNNEDGAMAVLVFANTATMPAAKGVTRFTEEPPNSAFPTPPPMSLRTWAFSDQTLLDTPPAALIPSVVVGWYTPDGPPQPIRSWARGPQQAEVVSDRPAAPTFPLPIRAQEEVRTWTRAPLNAPVFRPGVVSSWPVPDAPSQFTRTWTQQPRPTSVTPDKPVNQSDWPLPSRLAAPPQTWTQQPQLQPVSSEKPLNQMDWPLPVREPSRGRTWIQTPQFASPIVFRPGVVESWSVPDRVPFQQADIPRNAALLNAPVVTDNRPRNQSNWPVPRGHEYPASLRTSTNPGVMLEFQARDIYRAPRFQQAPFQAWMPQLNVALLTAPPPTPPPIRTVTDLPPTGPIQPIRTWTKSPNFAQQVADVVFIPCRVESWDVPTGPIQPVRTWTQGPMLATPVVVTYVPGNKTVWELPKTRDYPSSLRTWIYPSIMLEFQTRDIYRAPMFERPVWQQASMGRNTALLTTPPAQKPKNQDQWPVPRGHHYPDSLRFWGPNNTAMRPPASLPPRYMAPYVPRGHYYPDSLRSTIGKPGPGMYVPPVAPAFPHNIPFIATMGAMTAR